MLTPLFYTANTADLLDQLAYLPEAVFLDSGFPYSQQGRFDIISANPYITLTTYGLETTIHTESTVITSKADPFDLLKEYLTQAKFELPSSPVQLPFIGGAIGYFAYDLAWRLEKLPIIAEQDLRLPTMRIGIYDWAIIVDHQAQKTWLIQQENSANTAIVCANIIKQLKQPAAPIKNNEIKVLSDFQSNFTQESYAKAFARIQTYLRNGDCYQVNLAQRFKAHIKGSPWQLYKTLRQRNPAAFSAFLNYNDAHILSLSPERFLRVRDHIVETKPIKGTRPRDSNKEHDQALAKELLASDKDRAENLMIVDLLRNDLSKTCQPGSVKVPHLFALESFPAVHHLVSTVTAKLADDKHSIDLLKDCFPGGSITGAPKLRAMEIIEELEPHNRNVYCGAIGYIDFNGNMDMNIAIRTLVWYQQNIYCYAGGAITIDSTLEDEYAETFAKVEVIFKILDEFRNAKSVS